MAMTQIKAPICRWLRRITLFFALCCSLFLVMPYTQAQDLPREIIKETIKETAKEITQDQAGHLQRLFQEQINTLPQQNSALTFHFDGNVTSEVADTHYAITLPYMKIEHISGITADIGFISINVIPAKDHDEGTWSIAIALPSSIAITNPDGSSLGSITTGLQRTTGLWHETTPGFPLLNSVMRDISFETADQKTALKIGIFLLVSKSQNTSGISNLLSDDIAPLSVLETLFSQGGDTHFSFALKNVSLTSPNINYAYADTMTAKQISFLLDLKSAGQSTKNVTLSSTLEDANFTADEKQDDLLPQDFKLDLALSSIPAQDLLELINATQTTFKTLPDFAPLAMVAAFVKVPNILAKSGLQIEVKDSHIKGPDYNAALRANIKGNVDAVNLAQGHGSLVMTGLNDTIERARIRKENAASDHEIANYAALLQALSTVKISSHSSTNDAGDIIHSLSLNITEDGEVTLNQEPFSLFTNLLSAPLLLNWFTPQSEKSE